MANAVKLYEVLERKNLVGTEREDYLWWRIWGWKIAKTPPRARPGEPSCG